MVNGSEGKKPPEIKDAIPDEVLDFYDKGVEALKRANFDYAVELFTSALALKQDFADARFHLWFALRERQKRSADPLKLKTFFKKIVSVFLTLKANSLKRNGRTWEAIYQLEKAMKLDPNNVGTLKALANCFLSEGQMPNAVKMLEAIPHIDRKNSKPLNEIGNLYMKMENYDKARSYYQMALKVNPYDMDAEHSLKDLEAIKTLKGSFPAEEGKK